MRTKLILAFSILVVFGLSIAAFAFVNATSNNTAATMSCCKGDACPMKSKDNAAGDKKESCCDMPDCCCKGDSCPMMKHGDKSGHNTEHENKSGHDAKHESKGCCCKDKSKDTV